MENDLGDKSASGRIPRVILGRYLSWLTYFGEEWVNSQIENLLPPDNEALCDATWMGHLGLDWRPVVSLMEYLRPCYMKEIAGLGIKAGSRQTRLEDRLGEFIINLYLGDALPTDVLDEFWKKAPERLLRYCMWALGRYLKQPPSECPDEVRARGHAYWAARLAIAKEAHEPDAFRKELGTFGQWCKGAFDVEWLIEQLCEMLSAGFAPESFGVIEWLAEIAPKFPDKSVEALLPLLSSPHTDQWAYLMHEATIRAIMTRGLAEGTPKTKKRVEEIVSVLSSKGETKYTDLLPRAA